jgi:hypothetical protein
MHIKILVVKPEVRTPVGRPKPRQEYNIKVGFKEVEYNVMGWIRLAQDRDQWLAQDRDQWLALMHTVLTFDYHHLHKTVGVQPGARVTRTEPKLLRRANGGRALQEDRNVGCTLQNG